MTSTPAEASPPPLAPEPEAPRTIEGAPVVFMRGGTTTSNFDAYVHEFDQDTKARWAEQDKERAAAAIPIEQGGAQRITSDMGTPNSYPVAVIQILHTGNREQFMQADVVISDTGDGGVSRVLVLICPDCRSRGIPGHMCQIKIDDRNKRWSLDERYKGTVWVDPDTNAPYLLAGAVDLADICRCPTPGCSLRFRISDMKNPTYPGVSRLIRE